MRAASRPAVALVASCLLLLTACGGDRPSAAGHSAAEPAVAPALTASPVGTSVAVGAEPEGIVYDPSTQLVAVAVHDPDRLLLLDATSLKVVRSVQLPGHARHLQLGQPGTVLVPVEDADSLLTVTEATGAISTVRVGKSPHDAALTSDGRIVVGDEFGTSLSVLNGGQVERTIKTVLQPGGVIAFGPNVAIVDVKAYTVSTYDPVSGKRKAISDAGMGPTHGALIGPNRLAVTDTRGSAVLVFSLSPLKESGSLALPGAPYGIAADPTTNTVWTTLTGRNEVVGLDVSGSTPREIARYATVDQPDTVTVAPGSHTLWVTGTKRGLVQRITR